MSHLFSNHIQSQRQQHRRRSRSSSGDFSEMTYRNNHTTLQTPPQQQQPPTPATSQLVVIHGKKRKKSSAVHSSSISSSSSTTSTIATTTTTASSMATACVYSTPPLPLPPNYNNTTTTPKYRYTNSHETNSSLSTNPSMSNAYNHQSTQQQQKRLLSSSQIHQNHINHKHTTTTANLNWMTSSPSPDLSSPPPIEQSQPQQQQLPVYAYKDEILRTVLHNDNRITLITAATGSGKSTQIPTYFLSLVSSKRKMKIAVTQPRRVAAITLAQRVIYEQQQQQSSLSLSSSSKQQQPLPLLTAQQLIGYRVRFQDTTHPHTTQLIYITDGMLLRDAMMDPLLLQYSIIFLDEAHERSLPTDIVMSIVKTAYIQRKQPQPQESKHSYPPLYVVVMSATLQIHTFLQYFGGSNQVNVIDIPGRQYPVQILYTAIPQEDYIESTLATILQIHDSDNDHRITTTTNNTTKGKDTNTNNDKNGDILVFLPGQEEIENMVLLLKQQLIHRDRITTKMSDQNNIWTGDRVEVIQNNNNNNSNSSHDVVIVAGVMICVLYAALPPEAQLNAFRDKPVGCHRKVILATNIAETSITIPSIKYVIDTGKYKCRYMMSNSNTGMECLSVADISQAQAAQRSGRAGRVESGICFRLYTEAAYQQLDVTSVPEILRVNLSQVILQLKGMGIRDPTTFDFVTPPNSQSIVRAMKVLYALSALDNDMNITDYGKKLAKLPLDPMYGHLLLQSVEYTCLKDMLTTVAVLSVENLLYRPSTNSSEGIGGSSNNNLSSKASTAHKRFISHEGDIPTYMNVYNAWRSEAIYVPPTSGGRKAQKKMLQRQQMQDVGEHPKGNSIGNNKLQLHAEWCQHNFVSGRALTRALSVRLQLQNLCERSTAQNGLGLDVTTTFGQDRERFLKCIASGLFLQAASRIQIENPNDDNSKGRSGQIISSRGRYRTKVGNVNVSVHPTSSIFNRQPAPKCVVYTELVVTKKSYIRGVTQIREEWLSDIAPTFYRS